jgi:hypothetical protein
VGTGSRGNTGLTFKNSGATRIEPRIADIANIGDSAERARVLFDYLEDWVPPSSSADLLALPVADKDVIPPRRPAPLEVTVTEQSLDRAKLPALPQSDVNARARLGWEAIRNYRNDFADSFNIDNYQPLPR